MIEGGAISGLFLGGIIALLPLFLKVTSLDLTRVSKDNFLILLFGICTLLLPGSQRRAGVSLLVGAIVLIFMLTFNQWNPLSINVMFQSFYISASILFFVHFYKRFTIDVIPNILKGMMLGSIIQSLLVIFKYFHIDLYYHFLSLFFNIDIVVVTEQEEAMLMGSLGNIGLLSSYLAMTSMAFLSLKKLKKLFILIPLSAIIISGSAMGLVSFVAGVSYYLNSKLNIIGRMYVYLLSIFLMTGAYFTGLGGHDSLRFAGWSKIFSTVDLKHFLIGKGPGWFPDQRFTLPDGTYMAQEHNGFISMFNVFGILPFLFLAPGFIRFLKRKENNCIFPIIFYTAFVSSYGHFTLHQSTVIPIIITSMAVCFSGENTNVINVER